MQVGKKLLTIEINYFLNYFFTVFTLSSIWKESAISTCVLQFILYLLVKAIGLTFFNFFSHLLSSQDWFCFFFVFLVERKFLQKANVNVSCCCFQLHHLYLKVGAKALQPFKLILLQSPAYKH